MLLLVGEVFAVGAQLKQLNFGGPPTLRNIEGRTEMMWIGFAFIALAVVVLAFGRAPWIGGILLIHAFATVFEGGWGYTVLPAMVAVIALWIVWTYKAGIRPQASGT